MTPLLTPIQAQVTDTEGKALAGIRLQLRHPLLAPIERSTDANGKAELPGLKTGISYLLTLTGSGIVPRQLVVELPAETPESGQNTRLITNQIPNQITSLITSQSTGLRLRLVLERAGFARNGTISDSSGKPVAGAVIAAGNRSVESGSDGRYSLVLSSQPGEVTAFRQGYAGCSPQSDGCRLTAIGTSLRLRTPASHRPLGLDPAAFASQSASLLKDSSSAGYTLLAWPGEALDPGRDTLWLAAPQQKLSAEEITAIQTFVHAGGKLVVNSEWAGFGASAPESLNSLLAAFGLAPGGDSLHQAQKLAISLFESSHPLLAGIRLLQLYRSGSIRLLLPDQARLLAYSPADGFRIAAIGGEGVLGFALAGKGKVVVLGDASLWLETDSDGNGIANYREADNARLWRNVLGW
ncbi:MAG: DUF4350 domain-containing protein [Candidatus Sericytochromatia bacterium]